MARQDWEDTRRSLIDTYRTLNFDLRNRGESVLAADHGGESIKTVVRGMKDHELIFAKSLQLSLAPEMSVFGDQDEPPVIGTEATDETGQVLISQFGSARATTLNIMAGADAEAWDRPIEGNKRMLDLAKDLAANDRTNLEKIRRMAGA